MPTLNVLQTSGEQTSMSNTKRDASRFSKEEKELFSMNTVLSRLKWRIGLNHATLVWAQLAISKAK